MKARLVDEYFLERAIKTVKRWLQSEDLNMQIAGNGAKNTLEYLGLWKEVEDEATEKTDTGTKETDCGCRSGSGEVVSHIR